AFVYLDAMTTNGVSIPPERVRAAEAVAAVLAPGRRVALTTHVNADGDGVGSEVALWHLLNARGVSASIANPTPIPERFHFLVPGGADRARRGSRVDLCVGVRERPRGSCAPHDGGARDPGGGARARARVGDGPTRRAAAPRRHRRRSRRHRRIPALHRRRATRAAVPQPGERERQGELPLGGRRGRGGAGGPLRRRRAPQGRGRLARGDARGRTGTRP